jgi:hypothetical protein
VIHQAERPFLFVYIHGWQNNANSRDVCRFEHFLDTISSFSQATGRKLNVIGVYIAWRGRDLVFPGLNLLTFYSRKAVAAGIASEVSCLPKRSPPVRMWCERPRPAVVDDVGL